MRLNPGVSSSWRHVFNRPYLNSRSSHWSCVHHLLSSEMERRLSLMCLLVDLGTLSNERSEHVHLSFAWCIVDRIVSIYIALVEQQPKVVSSKKGIADGFDRQILHDDEVKKIAIRFITTQERGIVRQEIAHSLDRWLECSQKKCRSLADISRIDISALKCTMTSMRWREWSYHLQQELQHVGMVTHRRPLLIVRSREWLEKKRVFTCEEESCLGCLSFGWLCLWDETDKWTWVEGVRWILVMQRDGRVWRDHLVDHRWSRRSADRSRLPRCCHLEWSPSRRGKWRMGLWRICLILPMTEEWSGRWSSASQMFSSVFVSWWTVRAKFKRSRITMQESMVYQFRTNDWTLDCCCLRQQRGPGNCRRRFWRRDSHDDQSMK